MMNTGSTIFRPWHWASGRYSDRWKFTLALDHYEEQHTGFQRSSMEKNFPCSKHSPWPSTGVHDGLRSAFLTSPVVLRCSELFDMKSITLIQIETHAISTFCWCIDVPWIRFFFSHESITLWRWCCKSGSRTSVPLKIWGYLQWNDTLMMKIEWHPLGLCACMPFWHWCTSRPFVHDNLLSAFWLFQWSYYRSEHICSGRIFKWWKLNSTPKGFEPVYLSNSGAQFSALVQLHMIVHLCALRETPGCTYR